ncbi:hypothetical protein PFISCL1PPCAC_9025, partial [Pristionchus fissidentatus]
PLRFFVNILTLLMIPNASTLLLEKGSFLIFSLICVFNAILSLVIAGERLRKDNYQTPIPLGIPGKIQAIGLIVLMAAFIVPLITFLLESSVVSPPMALLQFLYVIFHYAIRSSFPILSRFCNWITGGLVGASILSIAAFLFFTWEMDEA